jgi:hypothetical protein
MNELVLYDQMCAAIAQCAAVDEAAGIKDKAAQLEAYARVRDNSEAERQFAEIRLRASIRIGELSRDLETAQGLRANDGTKSKEQILDDAGLAKRTAYNYEQLTGGREKQAQKVANNAAEHYFAERKETKEIPTMGGLATAIEDALIEALGAPVKKKRLPKEETDHRFIRFIAPIREFKRKPTDFDAKFFASEEMEFFAKEDVQASEDFILFIKEFITAAKQRFERVFTTPSNNS